VLSSELNLKLNASLQSLETLRNELIQLQDELSTLKEKLKASETRSRALETALGNAESSLSSLKASFERYESEAEAQIRKDKVSIAVWKLTALSGITATITLLLAR